MNKLALAFLALGITVSLSACNTVSGFGEDVQAAGGAVTNASERIQSGS